MNDKVLIAPYAAKIYSTGAPSPKDYPHWPKLVKLLNQDGYEVVQIGVSGEPRIDGVAQFVQGWPFTKLRDLANECATWISVDSFWPHLCHCERLKSGIVLFGPSDPQIFGYAEHVNMLRGREYLRPFQYQSWENWGHDPNAFVYAENVMPEVHKLAPLAPQPLLLTANARIATA